MDVCNRASLVHVHVPTLDYIDLVTRYLLGEYPTSKQMPLRSSALRARKKKKLRTAIILMSRRKCSTPPQALLEVGGVIRAPESPTCRSMQNYDNEDCILETNQDIGCCCLFNKASVGVSEARNDGIKCWNKNGGYKQAFFVEIFPQ